MMEEGGKRKEELCVLGVLCGEKKDATTETQRAQRTAEEG
jgi:hypothetical protein